MLIWIALFLGLEPDVFHACSYSHRLPFSWGSNPVRFTYIPVDCSSPGARALISCSTYVPIDCPSPGARILYVSWGVSWTVSWGVLSVVSCRLSWGVPSIVVASVRVRPFLRRPASELNRILNSSWLRAPHVSITTSSVRFMRSDSSSLRSKSVRSGFGGHARVDPQRSRAQRSSAQHGKFQVSTARRSTAPGTVHRRRYRQHRNCPSPNSVS